MSYLAHIQRCNAHDLGRFLPFTIGAEQVGWIRPAVRDVLLGLHSEFEAAGAGVRVAARHASFDGRSAALTAGAAALVEAGVIRGLRTERYGVTNAWGRPPLAAIDRGAVEAFGCRAYGVHVNGWRRRPDGGIAMWIGVRAGDKAVEPGKRDNMVAGGQPLGLGLMANLAKEAAEEADVPPALAAQARPVGAIAYVMAGQVGLKPDMLFCYDLETPADFTPRNTDGEMERFELLALEDIAEAIRTTDTYKFNVNLVVLDFMIRHGVLDPDTCPDYAAIVAGLHRSPNALC